MEKVIGDTPEKTRSIYEMGNIPKIVIHKKEELPEEIISSLSKPLFKSLPETGYKIEPENIRCLNESEYPGMAAYFGSFCFSATERKKENLQLAASSCKSPPTKRP